MYLISKTILQQGLLIEITKQCVKLLQELTCFYCFSVLVAWFSATAGDRFYQKTSKTTSLPQESADIRKELRANNFLLIS